MFKGVKDKGPTDQDVMVRVLGDAGVYVARWAELRVYPLYWDQKNGWRMVQGYELGQLLDPERVDWQLMGQFERWLSGAASEGLLEEPVKIGDAVALLKREVKAGWEQELPVKGPANRFMWRNGVWVDDDPRPKWATEPKRLPVKLPVE